MSLNVIAFEDFKIMLQYNIVTIHTARLKEPKYQNLVNNIENITECSYPESNINPNLYMVLYINDLEKYINNDGIHYYFRYFDPDIMYDILNIMYVSYFNNEIEIMYTCAPLEFRGNNILSEMVRFLQVANPEILKITINVNIYTTFFLAIVKACLKHNFVKEAGNSSIFKFVWNRNDKFLNNYDKQTEGEKIINDQQTIMSNNGFDLKYYTIDPHFFKHVIELVKTKYNEFLGYFIENPTTNKNNNFVSLTAQISSEGDAHHVNANSIPVFNKMSFHTHPLSSYILYGVTVAWPSDQDIQMFIEQFIFKRFRSHFVFAVEGFYIIRLSLPFQKVIVDHPWFFNWNNPGFKNFTDKLKYETNQGLLLRNINLDTPILGKCFTQINRLCNEYKTIFNEYEQHQNPEYNHKLQMYLKVYESLLNNNEFVYEKEKFILKIINDFNNLVFREYLNSPLNFNDNELNIKIFDFEFHKYNENNYSGKFFSLYYLKQQ